MQKSPEFNFEQLLGGEARNSGFSLNRMIKLIRSKKFGMRVTELCSAGVTLVYTYATIQSIRTENTLAAIVSGVCLASSALVTIGADIDANLPPEAFTD